MLLWRAPALAFTRITGEFPGVLLLLTRRGTGKRRGYEQLELAFTMARRCMLYNWLYAQACENECVSRGLQSLRCLNDDYRCNRVLVCKCSGALV